MVSKKELTKSKNGGKKGEKRKKIRLKEKQVRKVKRERKLALPTFHLSQFTVLFTVYVELSD